jgi:2,5-diketo-D-gluconate reductase A
MNASAAALEEIQRGTLTLGDGTRMPRVGFGTAGMKRASIATALSVGLRMIDTATYYKNEAFIADAIKNSGVARADLFLVSKAWPFVGKKKSRAFDAPAIDGATLRTQVEDHIKKMGVGYLDVLLLHWPTKRICEHWATMVELRSRGSIRSLGLSNAGPDHMRILRDCVSPPFESPALLQTDLGPVKGDARITSGVEEVVREARSRGTALMSHSPLVQVMRDGRAQRLAAKLNVSVPQLSIRYCLQRGFALVFSSKHGEHMQDNLKVFGFELSETHMAEIACWRDEPHCAEVHGAVGRQGGGGSAGRRLFQASHWLRGGVGDFAVPLWPGELDPAQARVTNPSVGVEMRAAGEMAVVSPQVSTALGSIEAMRVPNLPPDVPCTGTARRFCNFRLHLAGTTDTRRTRFFDTRYESLVHSLRAKMAWSFEQPHIATRWMKQDGKGAQHVARLNESADFGNYSFKKELHAIERDYLFPLLGETVFGQSAATMARRVRVRSLSRNIKDFEEANRTRSMLWHWDSMPDDMIKVILYVNDVDYRNGCMVAMRHRETNQTIRLRSLWPPREFPWGPNIFPAMPRPWLAELLRTGYEPHCLSGPAGTMVIFDTNIVHRGSRPLMGHHRDFVYYEFNGGPRTRG